jgi:hypothetical protein
MVHQAIGRGILRFTQDRVEQHRLELVRKLGEILRLLLPKTSDTALDSAAQKIVDKAVELKKAMTEEQALYRCFWIGCGFDFKDEFIEVAEEDGAGRVLICTFPGLARIIKKDNQSSEIIVVKAGAILESAIS